MFRLPFVLVAACWVNTPPATTPMVVSGAPGSVEAQPTTEDPNSGTVECHDETITGSLISHTVCRDKRDTPLDRRNRDTIERQLEKPNTAPLPP